MTCSKTNKKKCDADRNRSPDGMHGKSSITTNLQSWTWTAASSSVACNCLLAFCSDDVFSATFQHIF